MPKTFTAIVRTTAFEKLCDKPCTPSKVSWIYRDYNLWVGHVSNDACQTRLPEQGLQCFGTERKSLPLYHILSWLYYCLVLSWCLILACFCWVLTQTTLVENTGLNAEYFYCRALISSITREAWRRGRASDSEYMNDCPALVRARLVPQICVSFLCPWARHFTLIVPWFWRSRKAVGPVYINIYTSVHVKEHHRLFEKSRGSSWYCWLYFKNYTHLL